MSRDKDIRDVAAELEALLDGLRDNVAELNAILTGPGGASGDVTDEGLVMP